MKLLAIESSTDLLTVALLAGERLVERQGAPGVSHSELALPLLRGLLEDEGLRLADLDAIVFGSGPGAFTGLRLACSVAQGLAVGAARPVLGVGSLEALALGAGDGAVYACLDARMNEVYCAAYRVAGCEVETVLDAVVVPPAQAPLPPGAGWRGCGSGFGASAGALAARLGGALIGVDAALRPRAGALARLAVGRIARGEAGDAALAAPRYVRDKVALTSAERLALGGKA